MKIKGIVDLQIGDRRITKNNAVTVLGDAYFSAKAHRWFAAQRTIEEGYSFIQSWLLSDGGSSMVDLANEHDNITVYLLNLTQEELDAITPETQLLPIYKAGTMEIDHAKVVGWASVDRTSTKAKQGVFTPRKSNRVLDDWMSSLAWEWAPGKTEGTSFNCIAIGLNVVNDSSTRFNGINVFRGIESNDFVAGETRASGYMCRPGVQGITSPTEILLGGDTVDGRARIKVDLVAKTRVELTQEDATYDFPLVKADKPQVIIGNKMYYFNGDTADLWVYDTVAGVHSDTGINCYSTGVYLNTLLSYNGYIYVAGTSTTLYAYNPSTYTRVSSADISTANLGIPTDLNAYNDYNTRLNYISISNYANEGYIIAYTASQDLKYKRAVVVSDLKPNSIVKILSLIGSTVAYSINNEIVHFDYYVTDEIYRGLDDNQSEKDVDLFGQHGVKYCRFVGNMLSYLKYAEPQTIPASDVAKVEYCYKYE